MRVLITGGAGFIGSHLAEEHLKIGNEVYIIDDLSTGSIDNVREVESATDAGGRLFTSVMPLRYATKLEPTLPREPTI